MIKHIVTFQLEGTENRRRQTAEAFKAALMKLPQQIEVLKSIEVGINVNPAEHWDVVLTAILPEMKDVQTYAQHPAHVAAAAIIKPYCKGRACVDYVEDA